MPLKVDSVSTGNLQIANQQLNIGGIGSQYAKLNKNWEYIAVGSEETIIDTILAPAKISCGFFDPYISFFGNVSEERYDGLTYKIYLNEKPVLDGNEIQISSDSDLSVGGNSFQVSTTFLQNIINNGGDIRASYFIKEQEKTTITYIPQSNFLGGQYTIETLETYDCEKEYYVILTATKTGDRIGVASLGAVLATYSR